MRPDVLERTGSYLLIEGCKEEKDVSRLRSLSTCIRAIEINWSSKLLLKNAFMHATAGGDLPLARPVQPRCIAGVKSRCTQEPFPWDHRGFDCVASRSLPSPSPQAHPPP